jgi:hypothetical protein
MVAEDVSGFVAAVRAAPVDGLPWSVWADYRDERDGTGSCARAVGRWLSGEGGELSEGAALLFLRVWAAGGADAVAERLRAVNGRRRERVLSLGRVAWAVGSALGSADGWCSVGGGSVANAYGYRSYQTACLAAVRSDGLVRVGLAAVSGTRGASLVTPFGFTLAQARRPGVVRAWADADRS